MNKQFTALSKGLTFGCCLLFVLLGGSLRAQEPGDTAEIVIPLEAFETFRFFDDLHFQFTEQPGYTGQNGNGVFARYAAMWPSETFAAHRISVAGQYNIKGKRKTKVISIGLAAQLLPDEVAGASLFQLSAAWHLIDKPKHQLSIGGDLTYGFYGNNSEAVSFGDMIDPRVGFVLPTNQRPLNYQWKIMTPAIGFWHLYRGWYTAASYRSEIGLSMGFGALPKQDLILINTGFFHRVGSGLMLKPALDMRIDKYEAQFDPSVSLIVDGSFFFSIGARNLNQIMATGGIISKNMKWRLTSSIALPATPLLNTVGEVSFVNLQLRYLFL